MYKRGKANFMLVALLVIALIGSSIYWGGAEQVSAADEDVWDGTVPTANANYSYSGGSGSSSDPYLISTGADLAQLAANVNANAGGTQTAPYSQDKYFKLTNDIDLGSHKWTPIGVYQTTYVSAAYTQYFFWGNFDGAGFEIKGLYINDDRLDGQALFGRVWGNGASSTSAIKNLTVSGSVNAGMDSAGVAALIANTRIENCTSNVTVTSTFGSSSSGAGGVVGRIASGTSGAASIDGCTNNGNVTSNNGSYYIGGIVGYEGGQSSITNCDNHGTISSDIIHNYACVAGGVVGYAYNSKSVQNCFNTGNVVAVRNNASIYCIAGGIVGWASLGTSLTVNNVYNSGNVSAKCTAQSTKNFEGQGEIIGCIGNTSTPSNTWSVNGAYYSNESGTFTESRAVYRNSYYYLYTKAAASSLNISPIDSTYKLTSDDIYVSDDLVEALNEWVDTQNNSGGNYRTWKSADFWPAAFGDQDDTAVAKDAYKMEVSGYKSLDDYRDAEQKVLQGIIDDACGKIDAASDLETIEKAIADAKSEMDEVKTDATLTWEEEQLQAAKDQAIEDIADHRTIREYQGYRDDELAKIAAIVEKANADINAVPDYANMDEVAPIVAKAKDDIDAVKTNAQLLEEEKAQAVADKEAAEAKAAQAEADLLKAQAERDQAIADKQAAEAAEAEAKIKEAEKAKEDALAAKEEAEKKYAEALEALAKAQAERDQAIADKNKAESAKTDAGTNSGTNTSNDANNNNVTSTTDDTSTGNTSDVNNAKVDSKLLSKIGQSGITTTGSIKKKSMKIQWKKVKNATAYKVYYRNAGAKTWKEAMVKGKQTYTLKKLKNKGFYEFKIAPYAQKNGTWYKGNDSNISYRTLQTVTKLKLTSKTKGNVNVSWKKVKAVSGYTVYYSTRSNMKGARIKTIKGAGKTKIAIKGLTKGKKYYVKVRPYVKKNGKTYTGVLCGTKSVKVKK